MSQAQNNFFLWGAWRGKGRITKPFVTKKWPGTFKKVVFGESCVVGLTETGKVVSWGKDSKTGCLGLGEENGVPLSNSDSPQEAHGSFVRQHKRCRIDVNDSASSAVREGLVEVEVLSIAGECMLTVNVAASALGRELWRMILDKTPSRPGLQLVVSHTSKLVLHETLQQQGLGDIGDQRDQRDQRAQAQQAQVSATYIPVNLHAAWRFAHGHSIEDAEFSLTGITELTISDKMPALPALCNLPKSLRTLSFSKTFNQQLHHIRLPEELQSVTFGTHFNQSLQHMTWPATLQSVTFGEEFNQSLDNVTWPAALQSVTFGQNFNQNLHNVTWPAGLQSVTFGKEFNQSLDNVTWPAGLQSVTFGTYFNESLDNVTWPAGLQALTFGRLFDHRLDNVTWPAGLQSVTFGTHFNQSLDNVTWPAGLQILAFGTYFNQSLQNVTWPAGLQSVTFGTYFNQSLQNVTWPAGLASLTFGQNFNQNLDNVTWPEGLQTLTFGWCFNQSLDNVTWPEGVASLTFGQNFNQNLANVAWPAALHSLTFVRVFQGLQELDVPKLKDVMDIQMGLEHVVVLTSGGEVYVWGSGSKGQLGTGRLDTLYAPLKVEALTNEQIVQIVVLRNSTFALSSNGTVFAWGDNQDNILGLEDGKLVEEWPTKLTLLQETRVRKLEVFDGKTIIAHIRGPDSETNFGRYETVPEDGGQGETEEIDIFKGIDEMREVMTKTQEWWNHLLNIKHGEPCELPEDVDVQAMQMDSKKPSPDDSEVEVERLHRAERHLDALVHAARRELRELQKSHGSRKNSRFILCMFIDECRLRREKVKRTIAARRLKDAKARSEKISAYSVKDFSSKAEESINRLTEDRKKLAEMRDAVQAIVIPSSDVLSEQLQVTLLECLECKLQLLSTQLQLVKARNPDVFPQLEHRDPNLMLPALEIIKARWDSLKHFSLYALYMEESEKFEQKQGIDDNTHLAYLVKASNVGSLDREAQTSVLVGHFAEAKIDTMLQIDKEPRLSHDSQVPGLCYDLLRENAELRKMANTYQLHVLMLYNGRDTDPSIGMTQADSRENGQMSNIP
eukprot:symbB.v1.2.028176.t1/scaffold2915.1/size67295/1